MSSLPLEFAHVLNEIYFLHLLATQPDKAVPPGKSLLSMMTHIPPSPTPSPLTEKVAKVVHKAFWDEALSTISSSNPSVQLPRLQLLYSDLHHVLSPLFPPSHPILLSLSAPLPPTSSPLHSTLALLKEILSALRQRCAPIRDPDIDQLRASLEFPSLTVSTSTNFTSTDSLASLLVSSLRSLIALAEVLKADLAQTIFGTMSEGELADLISQQARTREREFILDQSGTFWGADNVGGTNDKALRNRIEFLRGQWRAWLGAGQDSGADDNNRDWISRLMQALTSPLPISCKPLDANPNSLPPQFFFTKPSLLYIQNYLQALVIAASLKSLVRLPIDTPESGSDFMARIWALLKGEIDKDEYIFSGVDVPSSNNSSETEIKLVNLADEVIRALKIRPYSPTLADEGSLRAAVGRTLRLTDPVFVLLQGRLKRALENRVRAILRHINSVGKSAHNSMDIEIGVPKKLRTGGGTLSNEAPPRGNARLRVEAIKAVPIKGFDDEFLIRGIEEVEHKVIACVEWTESIWGDVM